MSDAKVNQLLIAMRNGNENAEAMLLPMVYTELRRLAGYYMRSEDSDHTLQATALLHEAYLKMTDGRDIPENRAHFMSASAQVMRRLLVDHARTRNRQKRGGGVSHVTLSDVAAPGQALTDDGILELHEALLRLNDFDERSARAIELMFFAGMTYDETAAHLCVSRTTVYLEVRAAKAWLAAELGHER